MVDRQSGIYDINLYSGNSGKLVVNYRKCSRFDLAIQRDFIHIRLFFSRYRESNIFLLNDFLFVT